MDEIDRQALDVMRGKGQEFAQSQIDRWYCDQWKMGEEMASKEMARWKAIKQRIGEIVRRCQDENRTDAAEPQLGTRPDCHCPASETRPPGSVLELKQLHKGAIT